MTNPTKRAALPAVLSSDGLDGFLAKAEIDFLAEPGMRNAAGGIYATSIYDFAHAVASLTLERCAEICEGVAEKHLTSGRYASVVADHSVRAGGQADGANECANAICALIKPPNEK